MKLLLIRVALVCGSPLALTFGLLGAGMDLGAGIIGYAAGACVMCAAVVLKK